MRAIRTIVICTAALVFLGASNCQRPLPNPGTVVVSCAMDAVKDPSVIAAVLTALTSASFRDALAALIQPAGRVTAEVIACILQSFTAGNVPTGPVGDQMRANPAQAETARVRARTYLVEHGYIVEAK